jgi:hypothetical protein
LSYGSEVTSFLLSIFIVKAGESDENPTSLGGRIPQVWPGAPQVFFKFGEALLRQSMPQRCEHIVVRWGEVWEYGGWGKISQPSSARIAKFVLAGSEFFEPLKTLCAA